MSSEVSPTMATTLHQRLLQDIAELHTKPYPNITLHVHDEDITDACLILTAEGYGPMHMTVKIPLEYPLSPPAIRMDSDIQHPNIYGSYICASILNTREGYTPAYTLKGIAIQLLSFFSSDSIEQDRGRHSVHLSSYRNVQSHVLNEYVCARCKFNAPLTIATGMTTKPTYVSPMIRLASRSEWPTPQESAVLENKSSASTTLAYIPDVVLKDGERRIETSKVDAAQPEKLALKTISGIQGTALPDEILLLICNNIDTEDLMAFAEAWSTIGLLMTKYDMIRARELQCFCLKKDFTATELGIGVVVRPRGKMGSLESEFDLLSRAAYETHHIRRSVQGVPFGHWLPLPISQGHWRRVRDLVPGSLFVLARAANLGNVPPASVIYHFMNDIVVKLNQQTSQAEVRSPYYPYENIPQSSLTHASEKAIESYFHLFHLLLCLATAQHSIVVSANELLHNFIRGQTSKKECPNLGHLLVAALISDIEMDEAVIKSIIKETITRNVVWMLDQKGANMPELAYLEPSAVSSYRLEKTFVVSKTSYRLLMFLRLFQRTAVGSPRRSLAQLRNEAFTRHGAPPRGAAKGLAEGIRRIHQIKKFPDFLVAMGMNHLPTAAWFTDFLRECVQESARKGYSKMAISQGEALALRRAKEPDVEIADGVRPDFVDETYKTFFPERVAARQGVGRGQGRGRR